MKYLFIIILVVACNEPSGQPGYFDECTYGSKGAIVSYLDCFNFKKCKAVNLTDAECTKAFYENREYELRQRAAESGLPTMPERRMLGLE